VRDEIDGVADCFMKAGATIVNDASVPPSVSSLLAKLQTARVNILHLACHGTQNKDPLRSAFILKDGELSVRELMRLDLRRAALAFLSASETAKGEQTQPDQAVHLAASMLFCGFKSIIGTMW
jgi:CHAT domain-containing protein